MAENAAVPTDGLSAPIATLLTAFVDTARRKLDSDLVSAVLFGSAADNKLGPASDVNLVLVLQNFVPEKVRELRDALLMAEAGIKLRVMFPLEEELPAAAEFFAQKFADILRRHRIIYGKDVIAPLKISHNAEVFRLRQVLLNFVLRLRAFYVARGQRPEEVMRILNDAWGVLSASSATLLELEGAPKRDSSAALQSVAASLGAQVEETAALLQAARRGITLDMATEGALLQVIEFTEALFKRASQLT
jgi:predicted nucleotidyltransferase